MGEPEKITNIKDLYRVWEDLISIEGRLPAEVSPLGEILVGKQSRVGRLRGYGNAIVPQVAAEFVRAFLDG
jgi:DNA (cytosine-5)-methyltransferase 1